MIAISSGHNPLVNALLASLPEEDFASLSPHLEWIAMPLGTNLHGPGALIKQAYFPCTAIVSLHYVTESGASAETAGVGSEAFEQSPALQNVLLRYMQALMTQIVQTAACYRHHCVEQQLSGWLVATHDRMRHSDELVMTQELLSSLLGVRRESITQAAGKLQALGHISYRRGHIRINNVAGLRNCACECYNVVRKELLRLAP